MFPRFCKYFDISSILHFSIIVQISTKSLRLLFTFLLFDFMFLSLILNFSLFLSALFVFFAILLLFFFSFIFFLISEISELDKSFKYLLVLSLANISTCLWPSKFSLRLSSTKSIFFSFFLFICIIFCFYFYFSLVFFFFFKIKFY